jgi:hypothetical protein
VGWSVEFSIYVGFSRGSVYVLTEIFCALIKISAYYCD